MVDCKGNRCGWEVVKLSNCSSFVSVICKLVGLVKCLLNELAISLLEVMVWLLNLIERLGSVEVGSLLLSDLMVFQ